MERLRAAEHRGQCLDCDANDVVERLLRLQRDAAGLGMEAQAAARVVCTEPLAHETGVEAARGPELCHFLEQVVMRGKEEGQARREGVHRQPRGDRASRVLHCVRECERQLLHRRRTRLTNVIARDRDRIPVRDLRRTEAEHVGDESQTRLGRIDVRAAGDVLLENVVLDGAAQLLSSNTALLGDDNVHRQQGRRGGVDGHRRRYAVEGDLVEQRVHVVDGIDRDTDAPYLPSRAPVVRIDSHLRRQVEGDRQTSLAGIEQHLEAPVGLGRGPKAGILAHRPQAPAIHRGLNAARVRKPSRIAEVPVVVDIGIGGAIHGLYGHT